MDDWTVLDLLSDPVPGDPDKTADMIRRLNAQARQAGEIADELGKIADGTERLRMRGDYAPKFGTMLAELPQGPRTLNTAYRDCASVLQRYEKSLRSARQQSQLALNRGRQADAVYRNALRQFCSLLPLRFTGGSIWRGLDEATAQTFSSGLPLAYREYAVQLGRVARLAEHERQQARREASQARESHQEAALRCAADIQACRDALNPSMQQAHEILLTVLNGNDELARRVYAEYYDSETDARPWIQKKAKRPLFLGHPVPDIESDSEGRFRLKSGKPEAIRSEYHLGSDGKPVVIRGNRRTLTGEDLEIADMQAKRRGGYLKDRAEIQAALDGKPVRGSRLGKHPLDELDRSGSSLLTSLAGEEFGETATRQAMRDLARRLPPGYRLDPVVVKDAKGREIKGGAGRFDLIYRVIGPDGRRVGFMVAEAKSPDSSLGARRGLDGKHYEQGHREYMRSIIAAMKRDEHFKSLAEDLEEALAKNKVDYFVVRAAVKHDGGGFPYGELTESKIGEIQKHAAAVRARARELGKSEDEAREIYQRTLSEKAHGVFSYDGYVLKQFDLGHPPVIPLRQP
ncbi:hypothetical protein AB0I53_29170 [Saccharopolyspora sp. NPDC050389]|uniref:hypothetical protein n=1 Tax=Saccharopolyspora sp. NPDC050389 TaxID=3155516 RepID=UPI0033FA87AD